MNRSTLTCLRCGYLWFPQRAKRPPRCAKCRSPYWNKRRRRPKKEPGLPLLDRSILCEKCERDGRRPFCADCKALRVPEHGSRGTEA
jgi:hypothetical protein